MSELNSLCKNVFLISFGKFPVFSLSGKMGPPNSLFSLCRGNPVLFNISTKEKHGKNLPVVSSGIHVSMTGVVAVASGDPPVASGRRHALDLSVQAQLGLFLIFTTSSLPTFAKLMSLLKNILDKKIT